jgi:glutamate-1-semialdehyde 2,1-aminomutase
VFARQINTAYNSTLRRNGIFKSPGKFYPSLAITAADLEQTQIAVTKAVEVIRDF